MTNTPSPTDEDRELIGKLRFYGEAYEYQAEAADRLESLLSDRAKLEERVAQQQSEIKALCDVVSEHTRARAALNRSTDHTP